MTNEEYIEELKDLAKKAKKAGNIQIAFNINKEIRKATLVPDCITCMSGVHERLDYLEGKVGV